MKLNPSFLFNVSHPDVFIYTYIVQRVSQTQQFCYINVILGLHVSTPSESIYLSN